MTDPVAAPGEKNVGDRGRVGENGLNPDPAPAPAALLFNSEVEGINDELPVE